ncbi:hypothetical protein ACP2AV_13940 [Aliiroseovarius sp. PTFE2010]|uniref:hypothetical protein n=1 Tax=Aliiroseovarius sp. PTFE2010 TaxID=3417190 RepID=UPI003CECD9CE
MRKSIWIVSVVALTGLAACGDSPLEQGLMGAGAGAAAGAVTGGDVATGAAIGAAGNVLYCQQYPTRCN